MVRMLSDSLTIGRRFTCSLPGSEGTLYYVRIVLVLTRRLSSTRRTSIIRKAPTNPVNRLSMLILIPLISGVRNEVRIILVHSQQWA